VESLKLLGRKTARVYVAKNLNDALKRLVAEHDENVCRKDFTPSEAVEVGQDIESKLKPAAEAKKKTGKSADGTAGGCGKKKDKPSVILAEGFPDSNQSPQNAKPPPKKTSPAKQTRDKVAEAVGMKRTRFAKAKKVVEAAKAEPEKFSDLVEQMDTTVTVHGSRVTSV
jgi:hypothetical protein